MNLLRLFRGLIGIADPEILLLRPVLKMEILDTEDISALKDWCVSEASGYEFQTLAISKFTSLGIFDQSEMGGPVEMLDDHYANAYAPAAFFKWRMLESLDVERAISSRSHESYLDVAVKDKYPPALTSMAFREKESGREDSFEKRILEAADLGDPYALNWVGSKLLSAPEVDQRKRGFEFLEASANAGFFLACIQLERIYRYGAYGVSVDAQKADRYSAASDIDLSDESFLRTLKSLHSPAPRVTGE
jgi:hypothetical protein